MNLVCYTLTGNKRFKFLTDLPENEIHALIAKQISYREDYLTLQSTVIVKFNPQLHGDERLYKQCNS